jgi:osmoprotectant transport system permease protein
VLLVSPKRARDAEFLAALKPLLGSIPIDRMRQANLMVDRDENKQSPEAAARWLFRPAPAPSVPRSR